jgi:hypothetical protein
MQRKVLYPRFISPINKAPEPTQSDSSFASSGRHGASASIGTDGPRRLVTNMQSNAFRIAWVSITPRRELARLSTQIPAHNRFIPIPVRIDLIATESHRSALSRRRCFLQLLTSISRIGAGRPKLEVAAAEKRVQRGLAHDGEDRLFVQALLQRCSRVEHGEHALRQ